MRRRVVAPAALLAVALPLLCGACRTLQPYEREILADPALRLDPEPLEESERRRGREAQEGGAAPSGGLP